MQTKNTPLPKSRLQLEFELPPERLDRAIGQAVPRLARQTKVSGFRPGKAPRVVLERVLGPSAVLHEALDQLVDDSYREAVVEQDIAPITQPEIEMIQGEEGKPVIFKAIVTVRPEITLGDFEHHDLRPVVEPVDEVMVENVLDQLREDESHLERVDRAAQLGDYAFVAYEGTRDGATFPGGSAEIPMILGDNRAYPGMDDHVVGLAVGEECEFDLTIPADFAAEALRGATIHFKLTLKELRAKIVPEADDEFARSVGRFTDLEHLKAELRKRLEANAMDRARHIFADQIVDYAAANTAPTEMPDFLVENEIDIMRGELDTALSRRGMREADYLKEAGKTLEDFRREFEPQARARVKNQFVIVEIGRVKGIEITEGDVEKEVAGARIRYANDRDSAQFFESPRGRNQLRSTLERSRTVDLLVDEWLAAHPEAPQVRHIENSPESAGVDNPTPLGAAALAASDSDTPAPSEAASPGA